MYIIKGVSENKMYEKYDSGNTKHHVMEQISLTISRHKTSRPSSKLRK